VWLKNSLPGPSTVYQFIHSFFFRGWWSPNLITVVCPGRSLPIYSTSAAWICSIHQCIWLESAHWKRTYYFVVLVCPAWYHKHRVLPNVACCDCFLRFELLPSQRPVETIGLLMKLLTPNWLCSPRWHRFPLRTPVTPLSSFRLSAVIFFHAVIFSIIFFVRCHLFDYPLSSFQLSEIM